MPEKSLAVECGSRLHALEGRTEATPSMAARGYKGLEDIRGDQLLGNAMEREALGSELDGNAAELREIRDSHRRPPHRLQCGMLNLE